MVKNLDFSHWINFCVFIGVLVRLGVPKMLSVTEYNHKICSKNHKLCTVNMKYQSPQKMAKKQNNFFSEGAYAQHKRRSYNLKGPRAARTCLVTLKRGLDYRTRAIISRGLYIFYSFFAAVYIVERLILQTIYVLNKEILQFLGLKYAVSNQERAIMACLRYTAGWL